MRIRHAVAAVVIPVVMSVTATPSFAGIFSSIEHAASKIEKGAVKEVGQVGKEVVHDVKKAAVNGADAVGNGTKATVKFIDKEAAKPVAASVNAPSDPGSSVNAATSPNSDQPAAAPKPN